MKRGNFEVKDAAQRPFERPLAGLRPFQIATGARLSQGKKTKHINAKVTPALFDAAARSIGSDSPAKVIEAGLAALAAQDDLGPWLAANWGVLADIDPEVLDEMTF
jgi:hypothetical protein